MPPEIRFSEDRRVKLLGESTVRMLNLKAKCWEEFTSVEGNQKLLRDFFENRVRVLVFSASSVLTASSEVSVA